LGNKENVPIHLLRSGCQTSQYVRRSKASTRQTFDLRFPATSYCSGDSGGVISSPENGQGATYRGATGAPVSRVIGSGSTTCGYAQVRSRIVLPERKKVPAGTPGQAPCRPYRRSIRWPAWAGAIHRSRGKRSNAR
jgi:hypothetical protein